MSIAEDFSGFIPAPSTLDVPRQGGEIGADTLSAQVYLVAECSGSLAVDAEDVIGVDLSPTAYEESADVDAELVDEAIHGQLTVTEGAGALTTASVLEVAGSSTGVQSTPLQDVQRHGALAGYHRTEDGVEAADGATVGVSPEVEAQLAQELGAYRFSGGNLFNVLAMHPDYGTNFVAGIELHDGVEAATYDFEPGEARPELMFAGTMRTKEGKSSLRIAADTLERTEGGVLGENVATIVGELQADNDKHVQRMHSNEAPLDNHERIVAVWRTPSDGVFITQHVAGQLDQETFDIIASNLNPSDEVDIEAVALSGIEQSEGMNLDGYDEDFDGLGFTGGRGASMTILCSDRRVLTHDLGGMPMTVIKVSDT